MVRPVAVPFQEVVLPARRHRSVYQHVANDLVVLALVLVPEERDPEARQPLLKEWVPGFDKGRTPRAWLRCQRRGPGFLGNGTRSLDFKGVLHAESKVRMNCRRSTRLPSTAVYAASGKAAAESSDKGFRGGGCGILQYDRQANACFLGGFAHPAKMASASTLRSTNRYIRSLRGLSGMPTFDTPTPRLPNLLRLGEHLLRRFGYPNFRGVRPSPAPRACRHLSQARAQTRWTPARKFLAVFS